MNVDEIIKKIDIKIAELEKEERANELLRKALIKKGIIKSKEDLSDAKLNELFKLLESNIK